MRYPLDTLDLEEVKGFSEFPDNQQKLLELYQNIQFLQLEVRKKVSIMKDCSRSCQQMQRTLGDLNDRLIKKSK